MRASVNRGQLAGLILLTLWLAAAGPVHAGAPAAPRQVLTADAVREQVKDYVTRAILKSSEADAEVLTEYTGNDLELPAGKMAFEFQPLVKDMRARRIPLSVTVKIGGDTVAKLRAGASIKIYADVIKARRSLARGHVIAEDDLAVERELADLVPRGAAANLSELIGRQVTRDIRSDSVIKSNMTQKIPLVKKGDRVVIVAERGLMKITAPGVIKDNGFEGGMVAVENEDSKKIVFGEVIDAGTVQVRF